MLQGLLDRVRETICHAISRIRSSGPCDMVGYLYEIVHFTVVSRRLIMRVRSACVQRLMGVVWLL